MPVGWPVRQPREVTSSEPGEPGYTLEDVARDVVAVLDGHAHSVRAPLERVPKPFEWNFTREDLTQLMDRLAVHQLRLAA